MTKKEKMVESWVHALPENEDTHADLEFDVIDQVASMPRVIYLTNKGYKITNWTEYAWAEINEISLK